MKFCPECGKLSDMHTIKCKKCCLKFSRHNQIMAEVSRVKRQVYNSTCSKCLTSCPPFVLSFHHTTSKKSGSASAILRSAISTGVVDEWAKEEVNLSLVCRDCHAVHHAAESYLSGIRRVKRSQVRQSVKTVFAMTSGLSKPPACLQFHHTLEKRYSPSTLLGRVSLSDKWLNRWAKECATGGMILLSANNHAILHGLNVLGQHAGPFPYRRVRSLCELAVKNYSNYTYEYTTEDLIQVVNRKVDTDFWNSVINI